MAKCETTFCSLCLSVITDRDFSVIEDNIKEVLDVLLLNLRVEENHEHVMCNACTTKLFAAFNFKVKCIDTEDSIFPYIDSENVTPVDLRDIYLKLRNKEHLKGVVEDERICRLCMQFITCEFTSVGEMKNDIYNYIPEVNFNSTRDPVICSLCLDSLNIHNSFLKNCSGVQQNVANIDEDYAPESPSYIKSENIEIKTDDCDEYGDTSLQSDELVDGKIMAKDGSNDNNFKHKQTKGKTKFPKVQRYKCDKCDLKSYYKITIIRHQVKHMDISELQEYKCDSCDYKTLNSMYLKRHVKIHKDISEVTVYKCDVCDFKSRHKQHFENHQLSHKDSSEVRMYICDTCHYNTKLRSYFVRHLIKHKDPSQLKMYKCDECDFESKYRDVIKRHEITHKDVSQVKMYKCDSCDYKTKYKKSLKRHLMTHKVTMYYCDTCDYKSSNRNRFIKHQEKCNTIDKKKKTVQNNDINLESCFVAPRLTVS